MLHPNLVAPLNRPWPAKSTADGYLAVSKRFLSQTMKWLFVYIGYDSMIKSGLQDLRL